MTIAHYDTRWVRSKQARDILHVTPRTLSLWARKGQIPSMLLPGGGQRQHRLYDISSFQSGCGAGIQRAQTPSSEPPTAVAIYARVSSQKQSQDLERQIAQLQAKHPTATVYSDVCSGINFNRRGLRALLEAVMSGRVRTVHIAHRDRLCRFAYDLVRFVLERSGAQLIVESADVDPTPEGELADDILSIITVFGARLYGAPGRGGGRKRPRETEEAGDPEAQDAEVSQPPDMAPDDHGIVPGTPPVVRRRLQSHRGRHAERGVRSIRDVLQACDAGSSQRPSEGVDILEQCNEETIRSEQCS